MKETEAKQRLNAISCTIDNFLNEKPPILHNTYSFLEEIQKISLGINQEDSVLKMNPLLKNVISIYCGSSYLQEPHKVTSISYLIDFNDSKQLDINSTRFVKPGTLDQGEYDSIYFSLQTLFDLSSGINISKPITVFSSNLLVIQELNGEIKCKDKKNAHKRNLILELAQQITGTTVLFVWTPSDSCSKLKETRAAAKNSIESFLTGIEENNEIKGTKKP